MYKLNEAEMFYDIADGQAVVINFATGAYFGTNQLGAEVLDRVLKGYSTDRILSALRKAPGCPENISEKLDTFIAELKEKSIIVEGKTEPGGDDLFDTTLFEDGFVMSIVEFKEVQDLILADPVHEVDEDEGWPKLKD